ncbi:MAG: MoaD/ThiS family protein [bacterium]|nr:MoaD/ThiS family protein [Acidimicrobiia bacterium]MCY4650323.1 MoaD/ThiS family protein [bacterium]
MKVLLHQTRREVEVRGPRTVKALLNRLDLVSESVLVIRGDQLLPDEERLRPDDFIEIRPVISGG